MNGRLNIFTTSQESLTLYDLMRMVRGSVESRFSDPVWISAEISELKLNRSGHCYLNLVEKGATDGAPRAEARAMIWRSSYAAIATSFESATGTPLSSGIKVLVRVVVTFHEIYGLSLQIIDIDPSYTLGEVERRRRETIARLQEDGVWDMNRELELPRPTLRIAIVSSATAAGYRDFMQEIGRCNYRFRITLFESLMQGDGGENSVINALDAIADKEEEFDVVAIIRGGGSTSDLALFDSYRIASHIAQFPLPIVTGIGHDKDVSVADMVAHTSCKTPTAVATLFMELADQELNYIAALAAEIKLIAERNLTNESLRIVRYSGDISRLAMEYLQAEEHKMQMLKHELYSEAKSRVSNELQHLERAEAIVDSHSVENILQLGFALLRSGASSIRRAGDVSIGQRIDIELYDGSISAEVKDIKTTKNNG
ncbi:MAG: exodeoxyribonuclease VII large subunit [Alistipes sp.]|nr:exodeoxyribonuclease VII large subunit [Alistipes sp.]